MYSWKEGSGKGFLEPSHRNHQRASHDAGMDLSSIKDCHMINKLISIDSFVDVDGPHGT